MFRKKKEDIYKIQVQPQSLDYSNDLFSEYSDIFQRRISDYRKHYTDIKTKNITDPNELKKKIMKKINQDSILVEIAFLFPSKIQHTNEYTIDFTKPLYKFDFISNLINNEGGIYSFIIKNNDIDKEAIEKIITENNNDIKNEILKNENYVSYKTILKKIYNDIINEDISDDYIDSIYLFNIKCLLAELLNDIYDLTITHKKIYNVVTDEHGINTNIEVFSNKFINLYTDKIIIPDKVQYSTNMFKRFISDNLSNNSQYLKNIKEPKFDNYITYIKNTIYDTYIKPKPTK